MKVEVAINKESIETIIDYIKENPEQIRGLIQYLGDEVLEILMSKKVLKKGAMLYRCINGEINYAYHEEDHRYK